MARIESFLYDDPTDARQPIIDLLTQMRGVVLSSSPDSVNLFLGTLG